MGKGPVLLAILAVAVAGAGQTGAPEAAAGTETKVADSTRLVPVKITEPVWPEEAKAKGVHGTVVLNLYISQAGEVEQAEVVSGDPSLTQAAVDCVKQWRFQPYYKNGAAVKVLFRNAAVEVGAHSDAYKVGEILSHASSTPARVRISSDAAQSILIKRVAPKYPAMARAARIQGSIVLAVEIDKTGIPVGIQVVSGHPMLIQAAIDAVRQWRYKPYLLNGMPVDADTQVTVNFEMH